MAYGGCCVAIPGFLQDGNDILSVSGDPLGKTSQDKPLPQTQPMPGPGSANAPQERFRPCNTWLLTGMNLRFTY